MAKETEKEVSKKKEKKKITPHQKRMTWTFFTLLFPSLMLCILVTFESSFEINILGCLLFFYQAVLLKNFIERHYDSQQF